MDTKVILPECPHALTVEEAARSLDTDISHGLNDHQVISLHGQFGRNKLPDPNQRSLGKIFLSQFKSAIVIILLAAALISYVYHHYLDVYIILFIVISNAIVGFIQEFQAERSLDALKNLIIPHCRVRRKGREQVISIHELVPGDIILVEEGGRIPADARLISDNNLQTDESSLTGESLPVDKQAEVIAKDIPMAERTNMIWMGSNIVAGKAEAIVTATGADTVLGSIAKSLKNISKHEDHFKVKTNQLASQMGILAIASVILMFIVGYFFRGIIFEDIFMFSIASLVSAIPEGLPVVLTIVLALSAKKMAGCHAIVRRLSSTETLSVVDTIITDKTGTLTQNVMTVIGISLPYQPPIVVSHDANKADFTQDDTSPTHHHIPLKKILDIAGNCHNVNREYAPDGQETFHGDPTEIALVSLADKASRSTSYIPSVITQLKDLTFNQEKRWRASVVTSANESQPELFVAGSPESVLSACVHILLPDHVQHTYTQEHAAHILQQITEFTENGMRVLALAYKQGINPDQVSHDNIAGLTFAGLVGIIDPPRPETQQAIEVAHAAGINVIMATGDHPATAKAIGLELGLITPEDPDEQVISEAEFTALPDSELSKKLDRLKVFARMTPAAKQRLATLLQNQGHVIAMTGDGVNDAPTLKQADIGISMGKNGTDVAREASDIILADDNFATIVSAIEQGRTQFRNIRRTSFFYISTNLAETFTLILFLFIGLPVPILPKQILWLNLVTAGATDMALAAEPVHEDVLKTPPRRNNESILNRQVIPHLLMMVAIMIVLSLLGFLISYPAGVTKARTVVFVIISLTQLYSVFTLRSLKKSLFSMGFFSSKSINFAAVISFCLLLAVIYIPVLRGLFEFEVLPPLELLVLTAVASATLWASEAYKYLLSKKYPATMFNSPLK